MHRQAADVATRKNSGDTTWASVLITRRSPGAGAGSTRRRCRGQPVVGKGPREELLDELRHGRPPAP